MSSLLLVLMGLVEMIVRVMLERGMLGIAMEGWVGWGGGRSKRVLTSTSDSLAATQVKGDGVGFLVYFRFKIILLIFSFTVALG